uniref:Uncharacterized protein n=1 Tax=Romanomermis culicivorax TaxID=13658 RepID=A0A915IL39_ROMCU
MINEAAGKGLVSSHWILAKKSSTKTASVIWMSFAVLERKCSIFIWLADKTVTYWKHLHIAQHDTDS